MAFIKIEGNAQLMKKLRYHGTPELVIKCHCERKKQTLKREIGGGGKRKNERKEERKRAVCEADTDGSLTLFWP